MNLIGIQELILLLLLHLSGGFFTILRTFLFGF